MAAPASSFRAVLAALCGNGFVTLIKFVAFFLSGSGAMLSEAIHSAADTGNQVLLYLGLRRGSRAGDEDFPYGYGGERFVFGLLSASGIFFVGCGVTVYHGIHSLLHPQMPALSVVTFAVLGVSLLVEGSVLAVAARSVARQRSGMPFLRYVREKADPAAVAILLEDSVAVLGVLVAAAGIVLSYVTGNAEWDAVASIVVGLLLGGVAIYLVGQNRTLLLGRAVPDNVEETFLQVLRSRRSVCDVHDVKTRQLTPEAFKFKAEVTFDPAHLAPRLDGVLPRHAEALVEPQRERTLLSLARQAVLVMGEEVDRIEEAVRAAIPEAQHIDIEVHRPGVLSARGAAPGSGAPDAAAARTAGGG